MTTPTPSNAVHEPVTARLSTLDRFLPVWIGAAMVAGLLVGRLVPGLDTALGAVQVDGVSLPIALGLLVMMYPVLAKVLDITAEIPKVLTTEAVQDSDVVITMGCGDTCPVFPGKRYLDWRLDDPAGQGVEAVRPIRDEIRTLVERLLAEIAPEKPRD